MLIGDIERGFFWNCIRSLFSWLDSVIYTLFAWVMQLIFDIVSVSSDPAFNNFYDGIHSRIYSIIAIFMLFKIIISLLTYLVNPDSINDKERGVGKMATRVIVSLIMLIAFPSAFQFISGLQPHILEALPRVVLGTSSVSVDSSGNVNNNVLSSQMSLIGHKIAFDTYNGVWFNTKCADEGVLNAVGEKDSCFAHGNTVDAAVAHINDPADGNDNAYRYTYMPVAGLVTGAVMTFILIGFCIDVAIRVFKLIILQILAPIPIISYIDPKSSKDGAFSKWLKMVGSTYLDLFIKLGVIYFVLLVISELITSGAVVEVILNIFGEKGTTRAGLVIVVLILGLLFFAQNAPKFIMDALGIKSTGSIMKSIGMGAAALGTIGSTVAATGTAIKKNGLLHAPSALARGLFSGARSAYAAGSAIMSTDKSSLTTGIDAQRKFNATNLANIRAGYGITDQVTSITKRLLIGYDIEEAINNTQSIVDTSKKLKEYTMGEGAKYYSDRVQSLTYVDAAGNTHTINTSRNALQAAISQASVTGGPVMLNGQNLGSVNGSIITKLTGDTDEGVGTIYMDEVDAGLRVDNGALEAFRTSYANANGISENVVRGQRIPQIKTTQKSNETKLFKLQQERGPKRS